MNTKTKYTKVTTRLLSHYKCICIHQTKNCLFEQYRIHYILYTCIYSHHTLIHSIPTTQIPCKVKAKANPHQLKNEYMNYKYTHIFFPFLPYPFVSIRFSTPFFSFHSSLFSNFSFSQETYFINPKRKQKQTHETTSQNIQYD